MPDILPAQGGMLDMILVKSIQDKVTLTAAEITEMDVKQIDNSITWNTDKDTGTEIPFEASEVELLKSQIRKLDEEKGITSRTLELCLKIKDL